MPVDISTFSGGGLVLGAIFYAGVSLVGTGPVIGDRMVERSGWPARCEALIKQEIMSRAPKTFVPPKIGCELTFGLFVHDPNFCRRHSDFELKNPLIDMALDQQRRVVEAERARVEARASRAGPRCSCAKQMFLEERRVDLAILAGSARIITPPAVVDLDAALGHALRSPYCAGEDQE